MIDNSFDGVLRSGLVPASGKTDAKGELKRTVKNGQTVRGRDADRLQKTAADKQ